MSGKRYKVEPTVMNVIKKFLDELSRYISIDQVYLYGSYARGDYLKTSDIDLIIISKDFEDMKYTERLDLMEKIVWRLGLKPHIQAIPYTPKEFREKIRESFLLIDASKYWIKIK